LFHIQFGMAMDTEILLITSNYGSTWKTIEKNQEVRLQISGQGPVWFTPP
jgi:hypothetical protein